MAHDDDRGLGIVYGAKVYRFRKEPGGDELITLAPKAFKGLFYIAFSVEPEPLVRPAGNGLVDGKLPFVVVVHMKNADGIGGAQDSTYVMVIYYPLQKHAQVRLPARKHLAHT